MKYRTRERLKAIMILVLFIAVLATTIVLIIQSNNKTSKNDFIKGISNTICGDAQIKSFKVDITSSKYNGLYVDVMSKLGCYQVVVKKYDNEQFRIIIDDEFNMYIRIDEIYRKHINELGLSEKELEREIKRTGINMEYGRKYIKISRNKLRDFAEGLGINDKVVCNIFPQLCKLFGYIRTEDDVNNYGENGISNSFIYNYKKYIETVLDEALVYSDIAIGDDSIVVEKNNKESLMYFVNQFIGTINKVDSDITDYVSMDGIKGDLENMCILLNEAEDNRIANIVNLIVSEVEDNSNMVFGVAYIINNVMKSYVEDKDVDTDMDKVSNIALLLSDKDNANMKIEVKNYNNGSSELVIMFDTLIGKEKTNNKIEILSRSNTNSTIVIPTDSECYTIDNINLKTMFKNGVGLEDIYDAIKNVALDVVYK